VKLVKTRVEAKKRKDTEKKVNKENDKKTKAGKESSNGGGQKVNRSKKDRVEGMVKSKEKGKVKKEGDKVRTDDDTKGRAQQGKDLTNVKNVKKKKSEETKRLTEEREFEEAGDEVIEARSSRGKAREHVEGKEQLQLAEPKNSGWAKKVGWAEKILAEPKKSGWAKPRFATANIFNFCHCRVVDRRVRCICPWSTTSS